MDPIELITKLLTSQSVTCWTTAGLIAGPALTVFRFRRRLSPIHRDVDKAVELVGGAKDSEEFRDRYEEVSEQLRALYPGFG